MSVKLQSLEAAKESIERQLNSLSITLNQLPPSLSAVERVGLIHGQLKELKNAIFEYAFILLSGKSTESEQDSSETNSLLMQQMTLWPSGMDSPKEPNTPSA